LNSDHRNSRFASTSNKIIFVVDDDELSLICRKALLETFFECNVLAFSKGADALEYMDDVRCDLLITDYRMPEMRGDEVVKRAHSKQPGLPIIMISGDSNLPPAAIEDVDLFVEKALGFSTFLKAVESLNVMVGHSRLPSVIPDDSEAA
jgi:two-component system cell cycle sensor histidine kinase/response regulator CckA